VWAEEGKEGKETELQKGGDKTTKGGVGETCLVLTYLWIGLEGKDNGNRLEEGTMGGGGTWENINCS